MNNKFLTTLFILIISISGCYAHMDRYSKEYLQSKKHISVINPVVERFVESAIKKELKKETGANFKVSFTGYTTSSIKKGIFKSLELTGKNFTFEKMPIDYINIKTLTDYNYIDYKKSPVEFKSDINFSYNMIIGEDTINTALQNKKYQKLINNINTVFYPLFAINNVSVKILNNKLFLIIDYGLPITMLAKDKIFVVSSDIKVENGKIKPYNVRVDSEYGKIGLTKMTNLINLLNPLKFTLDLMETKKCDGNVENVNIVDNKIRIDGKIFVKEDSSDK